MKRDMKPGGVNQLQAVLPKMKEAVLVRTNGEKVEMKGEKEGFKEKVNRVSLLRFSVRWLNFY